MLRRGRFLFSLLVVTSLTSLTCSTLRAQTSDLILDNSDSQGITVSGTWSTSSGSGMYGANLLQDGNGGKGVKSVRYTPLFSTPGTYAVSARWVSGTNRATNVPLDIAHADGLQTLTVNQQTQGGVWVPLGTYRFDAGRNDNGGSLDLSSIMRTRKAKGHPPCG